MANRGEDPLALRGDCAGELHEGLQAAAPRPGEPPSSRRDRRLRPESVDLAQLLLQQVGPVERPVEPLDVGEL